MPPSSLRREANEVCFHCNERGHAPCPDACQIMDASPRGYRAQRKPPLSQSQRKDMVILTQIRTIRNGQAGDISYVWTREGWLYSAVTLDLHSRRVIGLAVNNRMKRVLVIRALNMAVALRRPPKGCIHPTDRDSQRCSHNYQKILRQHAAWASMNGTDSCGDNAAVETFFKTIKAELLWNRSGRKRPTLGSPSLITSMASTIRDGGIQHSAGKAT